MEVELKAHAFTVSTFDNERDLSSMLEVIADHPLEERIVTVNGKRTRLDHVEWDETKGFWYLDFAQFRETQGPGKASPDTAVQGFDYNRNEDPCEETAAIYKPSSNYCVMQYNHHGVRFGSASAYLSSFLDGEVNVYQMEPVYDHDAERRFRNRTASRKLTFKISPHLISERDFRKGSALGQAIRYGSKADASTISLELSVGREKTRVLGNNAESDADDLFSLMEREPEAVQQLKVTILSGLDYTVEAVDLVKERLEEEFDVKLGDDRRVPREKRWKCLERAFRKWVRKSV